ncbi:uncharacterized protein J3D65DRAFT_640653 [Phyllosticta citribraziliensis]|uniref:Uncharacterized protein n=1 Tax=Phyllosticta citribraziliensis TaxID=989973 RepID=A0ABR1L4V8_9PEZI
MFCITSVLSYPMSKFFPRKKALFFLSSRARANCLPKNARCRSLRPRLSQLLRISLGLFCLVERAELDDADAAVLVLDGAVETVHCSLLACPAPGVERRDDDDDTSRPRGTVDASLPHSTTTPQPPHPPQFPSPSSRSNTTKRFSTHSSRWHATKYRSAATLYRVLYLTARQRRRSMATMAASRSRTAVALACWYGARCSSSCLSWCGVRVGFFGSADADAAVLGLGMEGVVEGVPSALHGDGALRMGLVLCLGRSGSVMDGGMSAEGLQDVEKGVKRRGSVDTGVVFVNNAGRCLPFCTPRYILASPRVLHGPLPPVVVMDVIHIHIHMARAGLASAAVVVLVVLKGVFATFWTSTFHHPAFLNLFQTTRDLYLYTLSNHSTLIPLYLLNHSPCLLTTPSPLSSSSPRR